MSEQELLEQLRAGMDTTPLHTGDLPPLDLSLRRSYLGGLFSGGPLRVISGSGETTEGGDS